ncbi:hypothetical protein LSUE1_G001306 [Lachnellula suecica]|uniref:Uncharacterized protein n=1 Tax=Lachnellula suecica TaxID=602035 RepID=A0A8T9CGC6_9HELO|nr:hypothetical protein LSUE1_G001306 [Lachnellula suecica]
MGILQTGLSKPFLFATTTVLLCALWQWPRRWAISGAPLLQYFILLGDAKQYRVLPYFHLWPVFTTFNLVYSICSTSWLLYWVFTALCYPTIFLVCLFQFGIVSNFVRRKLRALLKELHFIDDKIAFFNIPALEIDTEVDGLMVLRGITFSLSTLSFVVHGVEVGIKLSDDMELAIQTEEVTVKLFRSIDIGDCFANLKGGEYEMTFGSLDAKSKDKDGDSIFMEETPLLSRASMTGDRRRPGSIYSVDSGVFSADGSPIDRKFSTIERESSGDESILIDRRVSKSLLNKNSAVKMTDELTGGKTPETSSVQEGFNSMKQMSPDNEDASGRYQETLDFLEQTNAIHEARNYVMERNRLSAESEKEKGFDTSDDNNMRAAICSQIHTKPSVPHPPQKSIKVTTLQDLTPLYMRKFMHRLPMLLRLLLNPLSYFHPVNINSITATASGRWIDSMLVEKVFQDYADNDREIRSLKERISHWLSDANFAVALTGITGLAQVPFIPTYDIICQLGFEDVMAYHARFHVPSFLLPHHEHLLPPVPTKKDKHELEESVDSADGKPKEVQAQHELDQALKDETNVKISVHARLPACFDQELLDFVAALIKATKVVEFEKQQSAMDAEVHGIKEFSKALKGGFKEGMKKVVVDSVVNDRWISKAVGKITRKLEVARGEAGYSGDIPVQLGVYRTGLIEIEGEKLLP